MNRCASNFYGSRGAQFAVQLEGSPCSADGRKGEGLIPVSSAFSLLVLCPQSDGQSDTVKEDEGIAAR